MCDVIEIRLKRRDATRSGKGNQPLNIKIAVERPILKLGLTNFRWSFNLFYFSFLEVKNLANCYYVRCAILIVGEGKDFVFLLAQAKEQLIAL